MNAGNVPKNSLPASDELYCLLITLQRTWPETLGMIWVKTILHVDDIHERF